MLYAFEPSRNLLKANMSVRGRGAKALTDVYIEKA